MIWTVIIQNTKKTAGDYGYFKYNNCISEQNRFFADFLFYICGMDFEKKRQDIQLTSICLFDNIPLWTGMKIY